MCEENGCMRTYNASRIENTSGFLVEYSDGETEKVFVGHEKYFEIRKGLEAGLDESS